ncbi:ABC transporter permease [Marinicella sediminis]|uniref:ABC transporter permease n=1 Tax=Marinicella sediminis TaxID=1792834 RepID=A0ABV7J7Z0_9GAMM|nr:ABC transporter permease [Marinicella sediminis]
MGKLSMPLSVARIRITRVLREKWGLISWLAIPMIIVFLMSLIAGTGGGQLTGRLLITDQDNSVVSNFLSGGFNQGPMAEIFTTELVDEQQAATLMEAGDASAWITIPEGFGQAFLDNQPTRLQLVKNPAQNILPQMVETSMALLVDAATYLQIIFSEELAVLKPMIEESQFNDAELVVLTLGVKQQIDRLEETLFPPQLELLEKPIEQLPDETAQNQITFGLLMFPGAIFMALIFAANALAVAIWDDASNGVIPRLAATPSALGGYFNGQVMSAMALLGLLATVLSVLGSWYFNLPLSQLPLMIVWLVFSGLVIWMLFTALALLMPTAKVANITINATTFPLLMLGGSFFPMESMPPWLAGMGQFLPNGFLLKGLKDWMVRGEALTDALWLPLLLGVAILLMFWVLNRMLLNQLVHKV